MSHVRSLSLATLLLATLAAGAAPAEKQAMRPTEPFRREHQQIQQHLDHLDEMVGSLASAKPDERRKTMGTVVKFLKEHILAHADWEERVLYPAVDRRAGTGEPFTASMRYEHRIVGRWIEELAAEAARPQPDAAKFARRADNLLGLIRAHFEEEEEVLLPILDAKMTKAQFDQEIAPTMGH